MDAKRATDITVLSHVLVLFGLSLSGSLVGIWSDIAYLAAFILPTVFALLLGRRAGAQTARLAMSSADTALMLPVIFPTVLITLGISALTSFALKFTGAAPEVTVYETLTENLIRHALLPAILEEAAFRYLPMSLFGKSARAECIFVSTVSFALIHCSLFQIPYALFAGFAFILLNLIADSPLPSLILHAVNNTVSVLSIFYKTELPIIIAVAALSLISAVFIFISRKAYVEKIKAIFGKKRKLLLSYSMLIIVIPTLLVAILNLL